MGLLGALAGAAALGLSALPSGAANNQAAPREPSDEHDPRPSNERLGPATFDEQRAISVDGDAPPVSQNGSPAGSSEGDARTDAPTQELVAAEKDPPPTITILALLVGLVGGGWAGWVANRIATRQRARSIDPKAGRHGEVTVSNGPRHTVPVPSLSADSRGTTVVSRLVDGMIACYDLATNDAQRARIRDTLECAGVTPVEPDELTPFDPEVHHALGVEADDDPARAGLIARTERPGWSRDGELVRPPEVTVYPLPERASQR